MNNPAPTAAGPVSTGPIWDGIPRLDDWAAQHPGASFTNTPRAALRSTGRYAGQTRYGGDEHDAHTGTPGLFGRTNATVYRNDYESHAECAIVVLDMKCHRVAELTIYLDPAGLRDLACRLLDAAADIEAHPVQHIEKAAQEVAA